MDFIKEMQQTKVNEINKCVDMLINTIKAKYLYNKGGWVMVDKEFTDAEYCNPNFSVTYLTLHRAIPNLQLSILDNMKVIEQAVNNKLGVKAIAYEIDRKNHYFSIII